MKFNALLFLFFIVTLLGPGCVPPEEVVLTEVTRDLKDSTLQQIIIWQDRDQADSLLSFFSDRDPSYRYAAAMAFGSTKNIFGLDSLTKLLYDPIPEVRVAAAYAIGQMGDPRGAPFLMAAFEQTDTTGIFRSSNAAILEAVGKCAPRETLQLLSTISTYKATDTMLLTGQAWGIYRFALRGLTIPEGTTRMLAFVNNSFYPESVRIIAANYLGRANNIDLTTNLNALGQTLFSSDNPFLKIPLVLGIGKVSTPESTKILLQQLNNESDYRVRINVIRALNNSSYDSVKTEILTLINDPSVALAETAAQYLVDNGMANDATLYWKEAKEKNYPWQVSVKLYEAANKYLPPYLSDFKGAINAELRRKFQNAPKEHERVAILKALGEFGWNYLFLLQQGPGLTTELEKSAMVETLGKILRNENFDRVFQGSRRKAARDMSNYLLNVFQEGNAGGMAIAANVIQDIPAGFRQFFRDSISIIQEAQKQLKLPGEIETYNEVQKMVNDLMETSVTSTIKPEYNHPIDMDLLSSVTTEAGAVIQTDKGKIRLTLFPLLAPGSVVNFIKLAESDYYKGKTFQRVVPNFVIQGGCPRGDGYGSLDYSIRSELPLAYYDDEGYVGMASAGNHTEGTQFFITHSPTPHLDGRYTIFGKVTEGMDVVHKMEVGDRIQSVSIRY